MSAEYMTFEQAADFLSISRSTLYRWLREGTVPGHKVGRQWRFLRAELNTWSREGGEQGHDRSIENLTAALAAHQKGAPMPELITQEPAAHLVWQAADAGASAIHVQPEGEQYAVSWRTEQGLESLAHLSPGAFASLDEQWREQGQRMRQKDRRFLFFERPRREDAAPERLHVEYQKLTTLAGERVTLRLRRVDPENISLERLVPQAHVRETLRRWSGAAHGLVLISGRSGSGKTSTAYACLRELAQRKDRTLFTLEGEVGFKLDGVNQLELALEDERAYADLFGAVFASDPDVIFVGSTFSMPHRSLLWGSALSAAEAGHLVLVQLEAESAEDALERFQAAVERPVDDQLLGSCWQELVPGEGGRQASYELLAGPLDLLTQA